MESEASDRTTRQLTRIWFVWFLIYMVTGAFAMQRHRTSFFASTIDRVESTWLRLVFLNLPLQMVVVLAALMCGSSKSTTVRRVARMLAWSATVLVLGHITLSLIYA